MRQAKSALEAGLAAGRALKEGREALEKANESYKGASMQVRKHVAKPKKAAAKNKA